MSLLSSRWIDAFQARAQDSAFARARKALDARVEEYHRFLPPHPTHRAGYYHDFFCPEHAVQLVFDPRSAVRHACPVDGRIFAGEFFDSAWLWSVNDLLSRAALDLALRARLVEEGARDAARAAEILAGYARIYRAMPPGPKENPGHPGIVTFTGLDESAWIVRLAWAWAMLDGMIPAGTSRDFRENVLRTAGEHIRRVRWPEIHNATNWNNAALVLCGLAVEDAELVEAGADDPLGLYAELEQGVRSNGLWWEGSLSYHYYALAAIVWTVRALEASGWGFRAWERLRAMFHAPLALAYPDLSLPAVNDCWYFIGLTGEVGHGIPDSAGFYESAYAWLRDPEFAWVLAQNYAIRPRNGVEALLDGAVALEAGPARRLESLALPESGFAVLRMESASTGASCLVFKAGPDGGGHGHPDQLAIQLFAAGTHLAVHLGTAGYGIELNDTWYRQSASHSTVLLDGQSQPPAVATLGELRTGDGYARASGTVTWREGPYAGVSMRRTLLMCRGYVIDLFEVDAAATHVTDWIFCGRGRLVESPGDGVRLSEPLDSEGGYQHLRDIWSFPENSLGRLRWQVESAVLDLHVAAAPEGIALTGSAPGNPAGDRLSVLVRRRTGRCHRFWALFAPFDAQIGPLVRAVEWPDASSFTARVGVETVRGTEWWSLGD